MSDDMLLDDLQRLQRMIYKFEKRINDVADDVKHIIDGQGDQTKVVEQMADGYQDMRDRLSRIEGELNADRKTDVHFNAHTNVTGDANIAQGKHVNQDNET